MIIIITTIIINIIIITIIKILALISYAVGFLLKTAPLPPTLRLWLHHSSFKIRKIQRKQKWENILIFYYSYPFIFS